MKEPNEIKEKIITATTELITNSNGDIDSITIRTIAEKAGVGLGLINYHFQTKEKLIEICIQRLIENVILQYKPPVNRNSSWIENLKAVTKSVADFLIDNPSVSRISILSDNIRPQIFDNTMKTVLGFSGCISGADISDKDKKILMFELTSIMQALFLRKELSKELFGFDYNLKEERNKLLDFVADSLFKGRK